MQDPYAVFEFFYEFLCFSMECVEFFAWIVFVYLHPVVKRCSLHGAFGVRATLLIM